MDGRSGFLARHVDARRSLNPVTTILGNVIGTPMKDTSSLPCRALLVKTGGGPALGPAPGDLQCLTTTIFISFKTKR